MFVSFFPKPKLFFLSAALWTILTMIVWYAFGDEIRSFLGMADPEGYELPYTIDRFVSREYLFFYIYYIVCVVIFGVFWALYSPHPWNTWSIFGSALIIFIIYYSVQIDVALNEWRGPFFDLVQRAFAPAPAGTISEGEVYGFIWIFTTIATMSVILGVFTSFFISHWIFRWRTAMNNYFVSYWPRLRRVEGASQRVQEDTMRFAGTMEGLGVSLIGSVMTLIAFAPVLIALGAAVETLPIFGAIPYPLFTAAVVWSVLGTVLIALIGIRLPGLEFRNQRVEAAYRKELVYGEDDPARAEPLTLRELFANVRSNYFRLYFNYTYFNVGRRFYNQADAIILYVLLTPALVGGRLTLGLFQQIATAFGQVSNSFQYLFNVWPTVIELISIQKRLRAFEAEIHGGELSDIEREKDTPQGPVPDATPAA